MSEEKSVTIKVPRVNPWMMATIILAVILIVVLITGFSLTGMFSASTPSSTSLTTLTKDQIGKKVIDYINNNLVNPGTSASLVSVEDAGEVYKVTTSYQGRQIPIYATKDGSYLFLGAYDLNQELSTPTTTQPQPPSVPKSDRPDVKLFVMSYCPFGLQAEKALLPVYKLLKDKADIGIYFVDYCMHGKKELDENLRQYCIERDQKDKYYDYLICFINSSGDYTTCLDKANIDKTQLDSCISETDKEFNITNMYNDKSTWASGRFPQFNVEKDLNDKYGVRGSPTFVINDKVVSVNRSPESFKEAICSAFNNPPAECEQNLSTTTASPGFGNVPGSFSSSGKC